MMHSPESHRPDNMGQDLEQEIAPAVQEQAAQEEKMQEVEERFLSRYELKQGQEVNIEHDGEWRKGTVMGEDEKGTVLVEIEISKGESGETAEILPVEMPHREVVRQHLLYQKENARMKQESEARAKLVADILKEGEKNEQDRGYRPYTG